MGSGRVQSSKRFGKWDDHLQCRIWPENFLLGRHFETPDVQSIVAHSHYRAAPQDVGAELRVPEESADETGDLILAHRQMNQAIDRVAKSFLIEVVVAREERGPRQLTKHHDDSIVRDPLVPYADTDLTHRDAPTAQELPLVLGDVLVEKIHPATSAGS